MTTFSYPIGSRWAFTGATKRLLAQHGVRQAFSFYGGLADPATEDPLDIPRAIGSHAHPSLTRASFTLPSIYAHP
jgi:hypothetical protein